MSPTHSPLPLTPHERALAAAVLGLLLALLLQTWRASRLRSRLAGLAAELKGLREGPQKAESRIDRYDLLWFPTVAYLPAAKEIAAVSPGLPHCRACVVPLSLSAGQWTCPQCGAKHPESVADLAVLDGISKEAVRLFLERNKGYRLAAKG